MKISKLVKSLFNSAIDELILHRKEFVYNPEKDFLRNRKLDFAAMIKLIISMETRSIKNELLSYFHYDVKTATSSAFVQQRAKIKHSAFEYLFHSFNSHFADNIRLFKGYRLLAVDGSKAVFVANPADTDNYYQNKADAKGFCQLHVNALYDILSKFYLDITIDNGVKFDENKAFNVLCDRYNSSAKAIFIADRGYESYNNFAHCIENNQMFLIRVKDINSNGIVHALELPDHDEFDFDAELKLTSKQTNAVKKDPAFKIMPKSQRFDFFNENDYYTIKLRVVRFRLDNGSYECVITNLDRDCFNAEDLKYLYHMRWTIETSFRELKYAVGLNAFHAKKAEFIKQEIFARIILYNFSSFITMKVTVKKKNTKYVYQLNYTRAIHICRWFLRFDKKSPPDVEALIQKELLPIRYGRSDPRKVKSHPPVSFIYRF